MNAFGLFADLATSLAKSELSLPDRITQIVQNDLHDLDLSTLPQQVQIAVTELRTAIAKPDLGGNSPAWIIHQAVIAALMWFQQSEEAGAQPHTNPPR